MRRWWFAMRPAAAATLIAKPCKSLAADDRSHELSGDEQRTVALFQKCSNSVVHINTFVRKETSPYGFFGSLQDIKQGTGSGFLWDAEHIVTNYHVIKDADKATIVFADHSSFEATLVGTEPDHDLAVLRCQTPAACQALEKGVSSKLQVGQKVFAIGNPFGLDQTLTNGIVSGLGREMQGVNGTLMRNLVQTDAAINPGNSGGPLLDSKGRLIGVNTMIASPSGAWAGVGFAIPVDTVKRIVQQLIKHGYVKRAYLGLHLATEQLNEHLARSVGQITGVLILKMDPGSPAEKAGLRPFLQTHGGIIVGDEIVELNGHEVQSADDVMAILDEQHIGDTIQVKYRRREARRIETRQTSVQLGERPRHARQDSSGLRPVRRSKL
ncbi:Protease Do-like 1 [Durusdinium trenchii]|uniref:Chloroplastic (Protein DEGRADATION OF PERIPLASMIC PROTEINS 1) (DEGP PROTEASE 1) n=1 Tax=Durusdinium trenchii TaxID=1381693 RepID=A0ABP0QA18_9DINO